MHTYGFNDATYPTASPFLGAVVDILNIVLNLYIWILIAGAILSWLVAFNVINTNSRFVQVAGDFITRVTEPLLRPIRRVVPPLGGFDLSPLILILIILFLQSFLQRLIF